MYTASAMSEPNTNNPTLHHALMETNRPTNASKYNQKFQRAAGTLEIGIRNATVVNWYTAPITNDSRAPSVSACVSATMCGAPGIPCASAVDCTRKSTANRAKQITPRHMYRIGTANGGDWLVMTPPGTAPDGPRSGTSDTSPLTPSGQETR